MFEDWEGYVQGNDFCTLNGGSPWTCMGGRDTFEDRKAFLHSNHGLDEVQTLWINANDGDSSAPRLYDEFTAPSDDYQVIIEYYLGVAPTNSANGAFALVHLQDVNGNEILQIGFRDGDAYLDITNESAANDWEEANYEVPSSVFRKYVIDIDVSAEEYDLSIYNGGTLAFSKQNVPLLAASNALATRLTIGSFSVNDAVSGDWDHIRVVTP